MLKMKELASPGSCLNKAAPDEPVFVLRAKDPHAAQTIRLWAAMSVGQHTPEKIAEANSLADEIDKWRESRTPAAPPAVAPVDPRFIPAQPR